MAAVWSEDASPTFKSYRIKVISPQKNGFSFDSGVIKDWAENITYFVEGTICYVTYASEFVKYKDRDGKEGESIGRNDEQPRGETGECPPFGTPIVAGPITPPKQGIQIIYSDVLPDNSLNVRFQGAGFNSYQLSLESLLNSDVLWQSQVINSAGPEVSTMISKLSCDINYGLRVKLWSGNSGAGALLTNIRRHSFITLPCPRVKPMVLPAPAEGTECSQVGRKSGITGGYLECRRIVGDKNAWALVSQTAKVTTFTGVKKDIDVCKIKDYRPLSARITLNHSFPRPESFKPSTGNVDIALVGIDFSDAPGRGKPFDQDPLLQKNFDSWADFWSGGKLKWNWHKLNEWTRVPGLSTDYNQKSTNEAPAQMTKEVFTEIDKKMALKGIEIVLIYFPESLFGTNNGYMPYRGGNVKLPSGDFSPYYWGGDPTLDAQGNHQNISWYYYHEVLHGIGFTLHAPGNFSILGATNVENQFSSNYGYGSPGYVDFWSGFVNEWYDQNNITCLDKADLKPTEIELESIDINPKGQNCVMVKLSEFEILVIESRHSGPYTNFPDGFGGITVTRVDTSKPYARFDRSVDGFDWEKRQWSYYVRTDQQKSPEWLLTSKGGNGASRTLGYLGESFTTDGIKITVTKSGTFDSVKIEKISG